MKSFRMRSGSPLLFASCFSVLLLLFAVSPAAAGGICYSTMPESVGRAQGYTFTARLVDFNEQDDDHAIGSSTFLVEKVFAARNNPLVVANGSIKFAAGERTTLDGACGPIYGLNVGTRYLVSTANPVSFGSSESAIWDLHGNRAKLVRMYAKRPFDHRLTQPQTVQEVLALMLSTLPPTDAAAQTGFAVNSAAWATFGTGLALAAGLSLRLLFRRREHVGSAHAFETSPK